MPLALTDDQMTQVLRCAAPLNPAYRSAFLSDVSFFELVGGAGAPLWFEFRLSATRVVFDELYSQYEALGLSVDLSKCTCIKSD
jgi:hypothetical protein